MWVIERVLGYHHQRCFVFFFCLTWMSSWTPLSNQPSSCSNTRTWLSSKECPLSFRCRWTAESSPEDVAHLCCAICLWRGCFSFPNVYSIDDIALFVSWCFVLAVDQSLSECVGRFELHWDVFGGFSRVFFETPDRYGIKILYFYPLLSFAFVNVAFLNTVE